MGKIVEGLVRRQAREIERLREAIKGAEIALARDSDIDGAMRCLLSVTKDEPQCQGARNRALMSRQCRETENDPR